ncbi:MAG: hypothetical protein KAU62_15185 [Candidatus Heimdallarchaeota archaeon]|nr:hypothetical protein [Candidatus Heimdallarchaeota archaeon]MCG3257445.1 hypothetical protein [Candidatus Heimdallarchaeota archaeon]MCK4612498.1 hypothetical protein [Candidatus Heimdallarchaeota archaeon]
MRIKQKILFSLVIISFLSFIFSSSNLAQVAEYEFYYSDFLVPGVILEWNVATFVKEADFNWVLTPGHLVEEGDVIKFVIKEDPDSLNLTDPEALQYTTQSWVNTYLNDIDLSTVEEWDYYIDAFDEMGDYEFGYVGPERHGSPDKPETENYWESKNDEMQPDCFNNDSGSFEVSITADLFNLKWESYESGESPVSAEPYERVKSFEISYNIDWGYLDRMRVYESYEQGVIGEEEQEILELVLENSRSTQTQGTQIKWVSGLIALFTLGTITVHMRRR